MHVALYQPQIPPNTGNIGRLCVGMGAELEIIGPCAFDFSDKALRRAGLDYWPNLRWRLHADPAAFLAWLGDRRPWLVTKHGRHRFDQPGYGADDVIILGNEVRGIPADWHQRWDDRTVHIPILGPIRSFNLANAAAIVLAHAKLASGAFAGYTAKPLPADAVDETVFPADAPGTATDA
jgi:tRNA (cytidine/uridine-2'-O-)-methyltransferase